MKKILIAILIILLIVLGCFTIIKGLKIGNFEVLSYTGIIEKNENLENKITEASQLTSVTFPEKVSALTAASKKLVTTREQYQDKVAYSSEEDVRRAKEVKNYEVDFLFTRLGNYAKKHGLDMDLLATSTSGAGEYNLNFTIYGKYALIAEFIRDIENDSKLNFIIENFKITPNGTSVDTLKAEFVISGIRLNVDNSITNTDNISMETSNKNTSTNTNTNTNTNTGASANTNTNTTGAQNNITGNNNTTNTLE